MNYDDRFEDDDSFYDVPPLTEDENVDISVQQVVRMPELVWKILTYLPTCDVKSCNRVSSGWHQEAIKLLLRRTIVDFGTVCRGPRLVPVEYTQMAIAQTGGNVIIVAHLRALNLDTQIESYIADMGDNCHQAIGIHSLCDSDAEVNSIFKLGNKYGHKIRKLSMMMGNPEVLGAFPYLTTLSVELSMHNASVRIPQDLIIHSVKTFSLKISGFVGNVAVDDEFARSLLRMCPMIDHLRLYDETQLPALKLFAESPPDCPIIPKKLTRLALVGIDFLLSPPSQPHLWNSLPALKLRTLEIDFQNGMKNNVFLLGISALEQVLAMFAPTLKDLKLYRIPCSKGGPRNVVKIPPMQHLENLEITFLHVPSLGFTFGEETASGINYKKQFPVLKRLCIKHVEDFRSCSVTESRELCEMFFPEGTLPCHTLTRVDVDYLPSALRHDDNCRKELHCFCKKEGPAWNLLKRMIPMLPNVKEFKKCAGVAVVDQLMYE